MNDLFKAKTLNDDYFGTGVELSGFGILHTEFSERYEEEKRIESEFYLYTEHNGIVKVDEDSIREFYYWLEKQDKNYLKENRDNIIGLRKEFLYEV